MNVSAGFVLFLQYLYTGASNVSKSATSTDFFERCFTKPTEDLNILELCFDISQAAMNPDNIEAYYENVLSVNWQAIRNNMKIFSPINQGKSLTGNDLSTQEKYSIAFYANLCKDCENIKNIDDFKYLEHCFKVPKDIIGEDNVQKYFETVFYNNWKTIKRSIKVFSPIKDGKSIIDGDVNTQEKYNDAFYRNLHKDCKSIKSMENYNYLKYCFKVPENVIGKDNVQKYFEAVFFNNWKTIKVNIKAFSSIEGGKSIIDGDASIREKYNDAFYRNLHKDCKSIKSMENYNYLKCCFKVPENVIGKDNVQKYFETVLYNNWQTIKSKVYWFSPIDMGKSIITSSDDISTQEKYNAVFYSMFFSLEECKSTKNINDYYYLKLCFQAPENIIGVDAQEYFKAIFSNNWQTVKSNIEEFLPKSGDAITIEDQNIQNNYKIAFYVNLHKDCKSTKGIINSVRYLKHCFKVPENIIGGGDAQEYFENVLYNNWQIIRGNLVWFSPISIGESIITSNDDMSTQEKYNVAFYSRFFSLEDCKKAKNINDYYYLRLCFKASEGVIGGDAHEYFKVVFSNNWRIIKNSIEDLSPTSGNGITIEDQNIQNTYGFTFYTFLYKDCKSTDSMLLKQLKECFEIPIQFFHNEEIKLEEYLEAILTKYNPITEENIQRLFSLIGKLTNSSNKARIISLIIKRDMLPNNSEARCSIFLSLFDQSHDNDEGSKVFIKRDQVLECFVYNFQELELAKKPVSFQFDDEIGIDAGGLTKEAFNLLAISLSNYKNDFLRPVPQSDKTDALEFNGLMNLQHLSHRKAADFEIFGRIMANAFLYKQLLPLNLSLLFYKKLLGEKVVEDDLKYIDFKISENLSVIRDMEELESLFLNFILDEKHEVCVVENDVEMAKTEWKDIDLIKVSNSSSEELKEFFGLEKGVDSVDGKDISVTSENKDKYIEYLANYHLHKDEEVMGAVKRGFFSVISEKDIFCQLFKPEDIRKMLEGESKIDIQDWKDNSQIENCEENDDRVALFWEVLGEANQEFLKKLLRFSAALSRLPAGGFGSLKPKFIIECVEADAIAAHTCSNKIDLPRFTTKEQIFAVLAGSIESELDKFSII